MEEDLLGEFEACLVLQQNSDGTLQGPNAALAGSSRIFGGQLLAQALVGAATTVDGKVPRSVHMVFVAEGRPDVPVVWTVDAVHSGRSFATRLVTGRQGDRVLVSALVSMHAEEQGLEHQILAPEVARPEDLRRRAPSGALPCELRVNGEVDLRGASVGPPELAVWMRATRPLVRASALAEDALLAYCSDATMMAVAMRPHAGVGFGARILAASAVTSQTVSFHRPFRLSEWMLFAQQSPVAFGARAYIRGDWFDSGGTLVASCAQETMIRTVNGRSLTPPVRP
ncbi:MAG TPA: acyl-CoA thioesterase domain-containing protein [Acidimicrobiales bacterium]|nr:acyl-CoA thioesterase domain-containing protein [Acidimicrobiales bacterium]